MAILVTADSGRSYTKSFSLKVGERIFQSTIARISASTFHLSVKTQPEDIWIIYQGENILLGDLAIRQRPGSATQERDPDKSNEQNKIQVLTACSFHINSGDDITLLTNCPARDWRSQRSNIKKAFIGEHTIEHKAGTLAGMTKSFTISNCNVLPEGASAYYGYCYDLNLNPVHPEVLTHNTLVLDIGDQTWNYVSMNPGGEPYDEGSGSIDIGIHKAYSRLQNWLEQNSVYMTQSELNAKIISGASIMHGKAEINYRPELQQCYRKLESEAYDHLNARLDLGRYQYLLLSGGGSIALKELLIARHDKLLNVISDDRAQFLNCYGSLILYMLR